MPTYSFKHNETGEIVEHFMSYSNKLKWLEDNPEYSSYFPSPPGLVSGVNANLKMDDGFKDKLHQIAEAHPNSALAEQMGGRTSKEVKVNQLAEKHGVKSKASDNNTNMPFAEESYFYKQQK